LKIRLIVLKSVGHWVGDIHQPLHVSFVDDRGGNNIRVSGQCAGNLHATWDELRHMLIEFKAHYYAEEFPS
jgi:S1/P1 Nuclease